MTDYPCTWHGDEPVPEKYFRLCIECGHVFVTREELIEAHRAAAEAVGIDPEHTHLNTFCGLCLHDFAFGERS